MTLQQHEAVSDTPGAALPPRVWVAVSAGVSKVALVLDASAAVSVQMSALVDVVNARLGELGCEQLDAGATARGRWALCWVDGTALKPSESLADQGVVDGTRLWLRFIPDTEARINVVEHVTTAVAAELSKRWPGVTARWAARVGAGIAAAGVLAGTAVVLRWRYGHLGWWPAAYCAGLGAAVIAAALVILVRAGGQDARRGIGDTLLVAGCAPAAVGAAAAVPGPLGAPHAALGLAALIAAAMLIMRFTGRFLAAGTAVVVAGGAAAVAALLRMFWLTSAPILLTVLLLAGVLGMHVAPTLARWAAGIRLPVFPSASGRWIFETRPDLPSHKVVAAGQITTLDGPESVRDVAVATDRAHSYLSGLLIAAAAVVVVCGVGLCDPLAGRRWLPLVLTAVVAVAVLLRGRSFTDRWQATTVALGAVAIVIGVAGRYAVGLATLTALLVWVSVMVAVPVAGLVAAVVVPHRFYTPPFRKIVEWIEYLCLAAVFPLAFWLMGVLAAIRYR